MAEQTNDQVQGVKTMLKGKPSSDAGASVKDQVQAALLKNKAKTQEPASGTPSVDNYANNANIPSRSQNQGGTNSSPNMTSPQAADPVISKIERTVDSINEVHSTMESLNKNMNMFVDLFNCLRGKSCKRWGKFHSTIRKCRSWWNEFGFRC